MPLPVWPATLPQDPYYAAGGPTYEAVSNVLRTQMEAGYSKQRRRFTAVAEPVSVPLRLTETQYATLMTFIVSTLKDANAFSWKDFVTGAAATYRFRARPAKSHAGGDYWAVTLDLEKLP